MKKLASFLGVLLLALTAPLAQGALQVSYSLDGAAAVACATSAASTGPAVCSAVVVGDVTILQISGSSNSPGTPALAQQFGSTLQIISPTAHTLEIWIAAQGFTNPVTPPSIVFDSNLSLTSTTGTGLVGLTSCVDTTNGLAPPTTAFCAAGPSLTNPALVYSGSGVASNNVTTTIPVLAATYSLSQHITLTLGAGSNLNVITSAVLTQVPEPASVVFLGTALLGVTALFRKKFKRS